MANRANEYSDEVLCPLINKTIPAGDCVMTQDIAEGVFNERILPNNLKVSNLRNICNNCKYHEYK